MAGLVGLVGSWGASGIGRGAPSLSGSVVTSGSSGSAVASSSSGSAVASSLSVLTSWVFSDRK